MKTENFRIKEDELDVFIDACKNIVTFVKYENGTAYIEYPYDLNLFYLGKIFQICLNQKKLCEK
jgi:hypothetical protein